MPMSGHFNLYEEYLDQHILEDLIREYPVNLIRLDPSKKTQWLLGLTCASFKNFHFEIERRRLTYIMTFLWKNKHDYTLTFSHFDSLCAETRKVLEEDYQYVQTNP